jgi:hypothetical protein
MMKSKNKKRKKRDYLSLPIGIFFAIIIAYMLMANIGGILPKSIWVSSQKQLDQDLVCMVNNAYVGKKQIEVIVDRKTYYGCCEMCKVTLKTDSTSRYATDPLTGERVDKAVAYIVLRSKKSDLVHYFKSKENFEQYLLKE